MKKITLYESCNNATLHFTIFVSKALLAVSVCAMGFISYFVHLLPAMFHSTIGYIWLFSKACISMICYLSLYLWYIALYQWL